MDWQPIETAPKDDEKIWGYCGEDAIAIFWHPKFGWVSEFRRMTMAPGYLINGKEYEDHSPTKHEPTHWAPITPPETKGA